LYYPFIAENGFTRLIIHFPHNEIGAGSKESVGTYKYRTLFGICNKKPPFKAVMSFCFSGKGKDGEAHHAFGAVPATVTGF